MNQYDNTNRGVLFTNDRKESDRHPDWKGRLNINGVDHWVDGWAKQSSKGELISLSLGKPCEQTAQSQRPAAKPPTPQRLSAPQKAAPAPSGFDDMDDDIPF